MIYYEAPLPHEVHNGVGFPSVYQLDAPERFTQPHELDISRAKGALAIVDHIALFTL
jgi:hypothetical protein